MPEPEGTDAFTPGLLAPPESVRRAVLRYLSGDALGVVSKFVRDRSGMLEDRLIMECGRWSSPSVPAGLGFPTIELAGEVPDEVVDAFEDAG